MNEIDPAIVREELDAILANEITSFIDMGSDIIKLTYNLATISCIFTLVDREKEIKAFKDSPPERFTIGSLLDELVDIGLARDENLRQSVDAVIRQGYATTDEKGQLIAELSSYTMVGFLDNMFPGMPGMNLIAFVIQMNEEVNSERKALEEAKAAFAQTLKQRGVSVTKEKAQEKAKEIVSKKIDFSVSKKVTAKLKNDNLSRLSKFVKKKKTGHDSGEKLKVRDVFDKGPSAEDVDKKKLELEKAEQALKEAEEKAKIYAETEEQAKEAQLALKDAEQKAQELEIRIKELKDIEEAALEAEKKEQELKEREIEMAAKEAELNAMEQRLKDQEGERIRLESQALAEKEEQAQKNTPKGDDDIEARIAALETDLAMPCPLCGDGNVIENTTEKGKEYFSCDSEECRFVSWDRPYHFSCPLCKNSYLIEFGQANKEKGLKCPRASCSYNQKNILAPAQNMAAAASEAGTGLKKKKRVVRRKKRK
ncbi:MAG: DNA topoisomerase I [Desulfobacterales bacterium]|nr:DNA topoisomerase I [Desulfobacterales bacterium]